MNREHFRVERQKPTLRFSAFAISFAHYIHSSCRYTFVVYITCNSKFISNEINMQVTAMWMENGKWWFMCKCTFECCSNTHTCCVRMTKRERTCSLIATCLRLIAIIENRNMLWLVVWAPNIVHSGIFLRISVNFPVKQFWKSNPNSINYWQDFYSNEFEKFKLYLNCQVKTF